MFKITALLIAAFTCGAVHAAPPAKITTGGDGSVTIKYPDAIQIEGYIRENKGGGRVPCGDCRDGVYNPKPVPPPLPATSTKLQQQLEPEAKQAFDDAAVLYVRRLRLDEEPLENESMVLDWLLDKAKNKLLPTGPWGTVLDSLKPTAVGVSDFDQAKDKAEMKRLRDELDAEERQLRRQREQNAKLYEENMRHLEPKLPPTEISRAVAALPELNRMQDALVARARLRSDDYGYVVQQLLSRTRFDADIRMPTATYTRVSREIWRTTPSNVCASPAGSCVLTGFRKGHICFCPNAMGMQYAPVWGKATRFPMGTICRSNNFSIDLRQRFPAQVPCGIPVNVGINPDVPVWEYVTGKVSVK